MLEARNWSSTLIAGRVSRHVAMATKGKDSNFKEARRCLEEEEPEGEARGGNSCRSRDGFDGEFETARRW